jgi:CBS domain-containing protein
MKVSKNHKIINVANELILNQTRVCFVVEDNKLLGVFSEGDLVRRALNKLSFDTPIEKIMTKNFKYLSPNPSKNEIISMFKKYKITDIPILDDSRKLIDIINIYDII